jgi:multidrug efflux system outer membrane protein
MRRIAIGAACAAMLVGCKVGPNYKRPDVASPPQYRAADAAATAASLGEAKWFDVFQDDVLRGLIKEAIQANYDVRIAAQRVLEAEGQLAVTRSAIFPQLNAQASATRQGLNSPTQSTVGAYGGVSWELDLFGKLRRATEAQQALLLASKENQGAVIQSLVAQIAAAYFDLREYDLELEYVKASLAARESSLSLVKARQQGGVATMLEVDQAASLVAAAKASQAQLERAAEQTENLIQFFLGKQPGPVARGKRLSEQPQPPAVPAGLPSELLARRPDLRIAEQQLVAANARVGVAKAMFFPSISLTGFGGYQTADLFGVINRTGPAYGLGASVDLPIFDAGRRVGNYNAAKAQKEQLVIGYQKAVNQAFREVSDALIGYQKTKEFRTQQEVFANTLRDQSRLSNLRYRGGVTSYLEVLDTERQRLTAEQQLAQAQRDELVSLVTLYKALGGGWQQ